MSRISTSGNYYHGYGCDLRDCNRQYCSEHRLLWRECDTAIKATNGVGQSWMETQDCPACMRDAKLRRYATLQEFQKKPQLIALGG